MDVLPKKSHADRISPENLLLIKECPSCQAPFHAKQVRVLERRQEASLIHMTCTSCKQAVVALVMTSPLGMGSVGMSTELSPEDVLRFQRCAPIAQDDILRLHTILKDDNTVEKYFSCTYMSA